MCRSHRTRMSARRASSALTGRRADARVRYSIASGFEKRTDRRHNGAIDGRGERPSRLICVLLEGEGHGCVRVSCRKLPVVRLLVSTEDGSPDAPESIPGSVLQPALHSNCAHTIEMHFPRTMIDPATIRVWRIGSPRYLLG